MNTIRLTSSQYHEIRKHIFADELEGAAFLIAGCFENKFGINFTVRKVLIPSIEDYNFKSSYHLEISAKFFNKAIAYASTDNITVIQCHSHPFAHKSLEYSPSDDHGESLSSTTVHQCLKKPMGSLLFGPNKIIGRAWLPRKDKPVRIDQIRLVDKHLIIQEIGTKKKIDVNKKVYDRQIRAFGKKGQSLLSQLCVGIVGLGGTGSSVAEQLAREGVQQFILSDHDKFSPSNITRLYGSYHNTKSEYKVNIIKKNIKKIKKGSKVITLSKNIISQQMLDVFKNCDVIFSCTDRHEPRSVLNELAHQYFIPVIDMGVGIAANGSKITEANIRISLSSPSIPCLYCTDTIKSEQILAESLDKKDFAHRREQGYITGLQDDVPSVIPLTTMAASCAVIMLKDLLFGIMKTKTSSFILDATTFNKIQIVNPIKNDCVCVQRMGKADGCPLSAPFAGDKS